MKVDIDFYCVLEDDEPCPYEGRCFRLSEEDKYQIEICEFLRAYCPSKRPFNLFATIQFEEAKKD
ncbi:hypothetical protein DRO97_02745 [Archaeoglobales archaeon]|nr:MAG: hypothetical protein DRO97_02745 [Archaeoglobales archaeon]